jgi:hypothetical protein
VTAGSTPASSAAKRSLVSYWWFALSVLPIIETELGGACVGFAVDE